MSTSLYQDRQCTAQRAVERGVRQHLRLLGIAEQAISNSLLCIERVGGQMPYANDMSVGLLSMHSQQMPALAPPWLPKVRCPYITVQAADGALFVGPAYMARGFMRSLQAHTARKSKLFQPPGPAKRPRPALLSRPRIIPSQFAGSPDSTSPAVVLHELATYRRPAYFGGRHPRHSSGLLMWQTQAGQLAS